MKVLWGWLPVIVGMLLILWLSTRPYTVYFSDLDGTGHRLFQRYLQYPVHVAEYAILGLLWVRALRQHPVTRGWVTGITLSAIVLTAFLDESVQHFVPTRTFALRDLVTDSTGGILAVAVARWLLPWRGGQS